MADDMLAQAVMARPNECVGMIGGAVNLHVGGECVLRAEMLAPAHNRSPTPETHFFVEPFEAYTIEAELARRGTGLLGYYHSHPNKDAEPSRADTHSAGNRLMIIVPLNGRPPRVEAIRAWQNDEEVRVQLS